MAGIGNLIPLIVLLVLVGVGAFIGYSVYLWSNELAERASKTMEEKNLHFTKEGGLKVGVKNMETEKFADKNQNVLVNVWNNASLPNYKSMFGWNATQADLKKVNGTTAARPSVPRTSSSQSRLSRPGGNASGSSTNLAPPEHRSNQKRSASPVPGSWE